MLPHVFLLPTIAIVRLPIVIRFSHPSKPQPWEEVFVTEPSPQEVQDRCQKRFPGTRAFLKLLDAGYVDVKAYTALPWDRLKRLESTSTTYLNATVLRGRCALHTPKSSPPGSPPKQQGEAVVVTANASANTPLCYENVDPSHVLTIQRYVCACMEWNI